ncbi:TetR family transcriptional regulator C-terminal domain-containing protein [Pseudomonas aeruginosa]
MLESIVEPLLQASAPFRVEDDPLLALPAYIRSKIRISRELPHASKVFASEIMHGAPHLPKEYLDELNAQAQRNVTCLQTWIDRGQLAPVDPHHLLFAIWAATQTYADFDWQISQAEALFADERDFIANAAQFSAFLFHELGDLNWAGFYLNRNEELVLGPFQGKVACVRIPFSKGVCGAAARTRLTQRVDDVHAFPGHIACDSASSSELVVPLLKDGRLVAVLDLDSPSVARFSAEDQAGIEGLVEIFLRLTDC